MNNFYILIYLTEELKTNCIGKVFDFSTSPHKNVWEAYLYDEKNRIRLVFSVNSTETALFTDSYKTAKKSNTTTFFEPIAGLRVKNITLAENDRFIYFHFDKGYSLIFKLFGNKPNCFLVQDGVISDAFKQPDYHNGKPAPKPKKPSPAPISELNKNLNPKNTIIKTSPKFPRHLIPLLIEEFNLSEKSVQDIAELTKKWTYQMQQNPNFRVLQTGNICLLPENVLPDSAHKTFSEINEAVKFAYYNTSKERRLSERLQSIKPRVHSSVKKTESTIRQLEKADKGLERAETYEQYGHLLMSQAHIKPDGGTESISVSNFYDNNKSIVIPVKPDRSIAENAQLYYDKSAKAIRGVEESKRRLKENRTKLSELETIAESLHQIEKVYEFDDWFQENEQSLQRLGILAQNVQKEKTPYKKTEIEGFEVWIGKNAKSNDRLTTDAHKEDVWMHARGVSGSHVVIRMNNRQDMPQKSVILKAASIAAWNSKARGAGLVPVIITKRKYVTKPKGAPAGTVRVQREQVELVKPQKIS